MLDSREIIILKHSADAKVGSTTEWLARHQLNAIEIDCSSSSQHPAPHSEMRIIVMGGDVEVWETDENPWLLSEKKFLNEAIRVGAKIFGICFGSQLVAEQLGSQVSESSAWQIGWQSVAVNGVTITPFHFHKSRFTAPPACRVIDNPGDKCLQGFYGENIVCFEFHTEIDLSRIFDVIRKPQTWLPTLNPCRHHALRILFDSLRYKDGLKRFYFDSLDRWMGL